MLDQLRVLTRHFFDRLFDKESRDPDADPRAWTIQLLALLAVPGLMLSVFLIPDHPLAKTETARMWARTGDRYVFVCYAMVVMGLVMTFKWDALFPDRKDYLILTSLPISVRRLFAAKALAVGAFLSLFIVAINLASLLILPAVYTARMNSWTALIEAVAAHGAAVLGGSLFTALFFAALQGVLINALSPATFRRVSPWIQMLSMALLVTTFLVLPLIKDSLEFLVAGNSGLLDYFPFIWFLGLYESLLPGHTLLPMAGAWGHMAFNATLILAFICAASYFAGYRRHSRKTLEAIESDEFAPGWAHTMLIRLLDRTILQSPTQRAVFHFIGKIAGRSSKHRILTAVYLGVGVALALSSLFLVNITSPRSAFSLVLSQRGILEAPLILSFLVVSGLKTTFNIPHELNANWMFQMTGGTAASEYLKAIRKWIFLSRIVPLYLLLAILEFSYFPPQTAAFHLTFDLLQTAFLIEVFFLNFNKVPFTCAHLRDKLRLAGLAAGYLYGFTLYVGIMGELKRVATRDSIHMTIFLISAAGTFAAMWVYRNRWGHRTLKIVYDDTEPALQQLGLSADHGYWRAERIRSDRFSQLDEEIQIHLGMAIQDRIDRGASPEEARAAAHREFGNVTLIKETTRAVWVWTALEQLLQDLRAGCRVLWKSPIFSATAVFLIALVIGGNTTIFSIVHSMLTRPAAGIEAENLTTLALTVNGRPENPSYSYPEYLDYVAASRTMRSLMASGFERFTAIIGNQSYAFDGSPVTANYFNTLGVHLLKGRGFSEDANGQDSSSLVAIIGYRVWQDQFHGAEDVVGRSITLNGQPATIVGVSPPQFHGLGGGSVINIWVPLESYYRLIGADRMLTDRSVRFLYLVGALARGTSIATAQREFRSISQRFQVIYPETDKTRIASVVPHAASFIAIDARSLQLPIFMAIFSTVTMLTLVIACANVANLVLARAVGRQRETAVRQSLGASRYRILRMLIAEGLIIALTAWIVACLFAAWVSKGIPLILGSNARNAGLFDFTPDWQAAAYAMILAVIAMLAFTVAPAIRAWRQEVLPWLKAGEHSVAQGRSKLSNALVVIQLAFSVVLLTSAGLAYRSVSFVNTLDLGFNSDNLLLVTLETGQTSLRTGTNFTMRDAFLDRLRAVPGVESLSYVGQSGRELLEGMQTPHSLLASKYEVGPDYLKALGLTPLAGRELSREDRGLTAVAAMINQNLAEALWPGQSAIGQTISLGSERTPVEIVGVAPNALFGGPRNDTRPNFIFTREPAIPSTPVPAGPRDGELTFYIRYAGDLDQIAPAVRTALAEVDPGVPVVNMRTMEAQLADATETGHAVTILLTLFSAGSLLIAAIGQYAVIAFDMRRKTREFGVRMAMGASAPRILQSVLLEGLRLTSIGLAIGLILSLAAAKVIGRFLYGITPTDVPTYATVLTLMALSSLLACYVPARRAAHIDPMKALRQE